MWPFKPKTFLDPEEEAWQVETWAWLVSALGGMDDLAHSPLVTPTRAFFPPTAEAGHDRALQIFDCVKRACSMEEWPAELIAQPERPGQVADFVHVVNHGLPAGSFSHDGEKALITYEPALIGDPQRLISTLAHELAHYRLRSLEQEPPGGAELEELVTEIAVAYLGFGIFGANAAFSFEQHRDTVSQGWSTRTAGYLGEAHWLFALAMFCTLKGLDTATVEPHLKTSLRPRYRKAMAYLAERPQLLAPIREATIVVALESDQATA